MRFGFGFAILGETAAFAALLLAIKNEKRLIKWERRLQKMARGKRTARLRRLERARLKRLHRRAVYVPVKAEETAEEGRRAA